MSAPVTDTPAMDPSPAAAAPAAAAPAAADDIASASAAADDIAADDIASASDHTVPPTINGGEDSRKTLNPEPESAAVEIGTEYVASRLCGVKRGGCERRRYTRSEMEALRSGCERRRYSRSEMEGLQFVDLEQQRRLWEEVYRNLEPVVAKEYNGLWAPENQKQKRMRKGAYARLDEVSAVTAPACLDVQNLSDLVFANTLDSQKDVITVEEESIEYSSTNDEDDSSSDEYDGIRRPAFVVEGEPDFESGPPLDGLEYLRRVRWEAKRIPKVKVAKLNLSKLQNEQTPYMPNIPEIAKCPPHLLPLKSWEAAFLADFSEIRQAFSLQESRYDPSQFTTSPTSSDEQSPTKNPTMSMILGMDNVTRAVALQKHIRKVEAATILSRDDCVWLFALCVAVDMPLYAEMSASLRSLLRKCSSLLAEKSEPDDEVVMLNMLVTIAGKFFGQSEI